MVLDGFLYLILINTIIAKMTGFRFK